MIQDARFYQITFNLSRVHITQLKPIEVPPLQPQSCQTHMDEVLEGSSDPLLD